ncbi:MAG: hypothetical protein ACR2GT_10155 [Gaiellaceae bacterium]
MGQQRVLAVAEIEHDVIAGAGVSVLDLHLRPVVADPIHGHDDARGRRKEGLLPGPVAPKRHTTRS